MLSLDQGLSRVQEVPETEKKKDMKQPKRT